MIHLYQNISSLSAVLSEDKVTAGLPVVVFYTQGDQVSAWKTMLSSTSPIKICSEPKPGTYRMVKSVSVVNADTVEHTVSVLINEGSVSGTIISVLLSVGDALYYEDRWYVLTSDGSLKGIGATGPPGPGTDLAVANITATTLDVTSSSGTDATLPAATTTDAGLMTAADKVLVDDLSDLSLKDVLFYVDAGFNFGSYGALQLQAPIGFAISDEYSLLDLPNDRINVPRTDRYYIILHALWDSVPAGPPFMIEYTLKVNGVTDYTVIRIITPDGSNVDDNAVWQVDLTAGDYYEIWIQVDPPGGPLDLTASPDSHIESMTWQKLFTEPEDPNINYYARTHHGYVDFAIPFDEELAQKTTDDLTEGATNKYMDEAFIIAMAAAL